jgi:hypothetical protein
MKIGTAPFAVLPAPPIDLEVIDGRGIRVALVEGLYFHRLPHLLLANYALTASERSGSHGD